jgi:hypothetical protein
VEEVKAMKQKNLVSRGPAVLLAALLCSCVSAPRQAEPPPWLLNTGAVYPSDRFIAQQGRGASREEAERAALAMIAGYFQQEVSSEQSTRAAWVSAGGLTEETRRTEESIIVRSQATLVAARYTEDPWYDRAAREYTTVAYLDREEAWTAYEPQARRPAEALLLLYEAAGAEAEPFVQALRYSAARQYAGGAEFGAVRGFAQALNPARAASLYRDADAALAALPERIAGARQNAGVYVECPADADGMIYNAAVAAFGEAGFPIAGDRASASALCLIRVEEGRQIQESGVFYYPELSGTVSGKAGPMFSFTARAERQGAINPDLAKRRAYTALVAALKEALPAQLNREQEALSTK